MEFPKISVIIPVYNVEKYLNRCIDSVINQTFKDIEIILVDDGATDHSGAICDQYAEQDARILVIHKKNGGLSDARNAGMDRAHGEFLSFVDSDDFIEPQMLEKMYILACSNGSDVCVCGTRDCYEGGGQSADTECKVVSCDTEEALRQAFIGKYYGMSVCSKIFKRELCDGFRFIKGKTSEDVFFTPAVFMNVKKVTYTTQQFYNYWHRAGSITTLSFSQKNMDVIEGYRKNLHDVCQVYPQLQKEVLFRLYWAYFLVLDRMVMVKNYRKLPQYREVRDFLKKNWLNIIKCSYFQNSRRIAALMLKINVRLYRLSVLIYNKKTKANE